MRSTQVIEHLAVMTRTSSGAGNPVYVGSFESGQLLVRVVGFAGVGAYVRAYWEASADRASFGVMLAGPTITTTGVSVMRLVGGLGAWNRCRWAMSGTAAQFSLTFALSE
jgi:hypothetical protein